MDYQKRPVSTGRFVLPIDHHLEKTNPHGLFSFFMVWNAQHFQMRQCEV